MFVYCLPDCLTHICLVFLFVTSFGSIHKFTALGEKNVNFGTTNNQVSETSTSSVNELNDQYRRAQIEDVPYVLIDSGTCSSHSYTTILNMDECIVAVEKLGFNNCTSETSSSRREVDGCSIKSGSSIPLVGSNLPVIGGSLIELETHVLLNEIGSCNPRRDRANCQCTRGNPCVCYTGVDPPPTLPPTDLKMFTTTWSLDLKARSFLLEIPLFKWAFETEIKNWINQDLQCSADIDDALAEFRSVQFFSGQPNQLIPQRLSKNDWDDYNTTVIRDVLTDDTLSNSSGINEDDDDEDDDDDYGNDDDDDFLGIVEVSQGGFGRGRGKCRGNSCRASRKAIISDAGRRLNVNKRSCEKFNSTTILQEMNKNVFSEAFFNYNLDVQILDIIDEVELMYNVTYIEPSSNGLNTIESITARVEGDPVFVDAFECTSDLCVTQKNIMTDIFTHFRMPEDFNRHECAWQGVNCDSNDIVKQIWIEDCDVIGRTIPVSFGDLLNLTDLFIGSCHLIGTIPTELGNLSQLKSLWLRDNNLMGTIPSELGKLVNLDLLNLSSNDLIGTIPSSLGNVAVSILDLARNRLRGIIPEELSNLKNIRTLSLYGNHIEGTIPSRFGKLSNLYTLVLARNKITGTMPFEMGDMKRLKVLDLRANKISGRIPASIKNLRNLKILNLFDNELEGNVPSELGELDGLEELILESNRLSGSIPEETGRLSQVKVFAVSQNQLKGTVPSSLDSLKSVEVLDLSSNDLEGTISRDIGSLSSLKYFSLQQNSFGGDLPTSVGDLSMLKALNVEDNTLTGEMPSELGSLQSLRILALADNSMTGQIPEELENANELAFLSINNNDFTGTVPSFLCGIHFLSYNVEGIYLRCPVTTNPAPSVAPSTSPRPSSYLEPQKASMTLIFKDLGLSIKTDLNVCYWRGVTCNQYDEVEHLELGKLSLIGTIPTHLGKLKSLKSLQLSDNLIIGSIPSELGNLKKLTKLELQSNQLTGTMPSQFQFLARLEHLYLHDNELTGTVPDLPYLNSLKTYYVSYNSLTGPIPSVIGPKITAFHVSHNLLTGTIPTSVVTKLGMEYLYLDHNQLTGTIPSAIKMLYKSLRKLALSSNELTGTIPAEIGSFQQIETIFLQNNQISGTIPSEVGNLKTLKYLSLQNNLLEGTIPPLDNLTSLHTLNVVSNQLTGISPELVCSIPHFIYDGADSINCKKS